MTTTSALWWAPTQARPAITDDLATDVAVVGGGYTGLWTSYWLARQNPDLRIVVLEKNHIGFGASGRNGGWASGLFPASRDKIARICGSKKQAHEFVTLLRRSVADLGRTLSEHHIDADFSHGGTVTLARTPLQFKRAQADVAQAHSWGDTDSDLQLLQGAQAREMFNATDVVGGTYSPHCAALHPGKLVRGLAALVESLGVTVYENSGVTRITAGNVWTPHARVSARYVVRATEGYTESIAGQERRIAPIWSLMIATEPLTADMWEQIGLSQRQTFSEYRNVIIYGQRTADGRLAFGGRGAPYHFNSATDPRFDSDPKTFHMLRETLCDFFPFLRNVQISHQWGGPLGISRDWFPSVGFDPDSNIAWSGSYVGDGVTASYVGGRTVAGLIAGNDSQYTRAPWVNHRSPHWEQEPFRWIGINAARWGLQRADDIEFAHGRASIIGRAMQGLIDG